MQERDDALLLSASDLSQSLACAHRTARDLGVLRGALPRPRFMEAIPEALAARGLAHEAAYVDRLRAAGLSVRHVEGHGEPAEAQTRRAMADGVHVIVQAALRQGDFQGRVDVLRRVEAKSALGDYAYEAVDTKLSEDTRAGTTLQLALYSALLSAVQGCEPEHFWVVTPAEGEQAYRLADFAAYFRRAQRLLREAVTQPVEALLAQSYPEPVEHCDVCRHAEACRDRRVADDHLSRVPGLTRRQRRVLEAAGIRSVRALAEAPELPKVKRSAQASLLRAQRQAWVQKEAERSGRPQYELRPELTGLGLARLPTPSPGDVYLDLEGDHLAVQGGHEYLFGYAAADDTGALAYHCHWASHAAGERAGFEALLDFLCARRAQHPGMHVYHYAPYEPAALKRLMGRYATREEEVDDLLRHHVFVDLYQVVREALIAGVERYSIKDLEPLYGFVRNQPLREASRALRSVEQSLYFGGFDVLGADTLGTVAAYNRDDCLSVEGLRGWLEGLRAARIAEGADIPRPVPPSPPPPKPPNERTAALITALLAGVPDAAEERNTEQQARYVLAHLLDYHRRDQKADWWEFFRLAALAPEDLLDEKSALAGLALKERVGGKKAPIERYEYPEQDCDLAVEDALYQASREKVGTVEAIDRVAHTIDIKRTQKTADQPLTSAFAHGTVPIDALAESLARLAEWVVAHGIDAPGPHRAARDLLLGRAPRLAGGASLLRAPEVTPLDHAVSTLKALAPSVLPIQGPPGTGKSFTASHAICALVEQGLRVGISGPSHAVAAHLLEEVAKRAKAKERPLRAVGRLDVPSEHYDSVPTKEAHALLQAGDFDVMAGTVWLWAAPEAEARVDVLVIDEAGQLSLAHTLAAAQAGVRLVLIGDPQQLDQPVRGSHPDGVAVSALRHVLGAHDTVPPERGLFLARSHRMPPSVCGFISECFYEARLGTVLGEGARALVGSAGFDGSGLWYSPVQHEGNKSASDEEAAHIVTLARRLLAPGAQYVAGNAARRLDERDLLVVVPYNAQVARVTEALTKDGLGDVRVGTVDRFQGQEAPVVIYGMTSSSAEDAPRGLSFLYSPHRFNVAISRAQCAAILVASPKLFEAACSRVEHVRLVNAFCRYLELAKVVAQ